MAGRWEPCKPRGFRTVLRAAGGEIPPADSPGRDVQVRQPGRGRTGAADRGLLAGSGLEPKAAKTRIVHLAEGEERDLISSDFTIGWCAAGWTPKSAHLTFLGRWPSRKAIQHARDRIREITGRSRLLLWPELIVEDLNRFLRGVGRVLPCTGTRLACSARSGITPWCGSHRGCPRKATGAGPGMGHQTGAAVPGPPGPDQPRWNRLPAQALPGLAGKHRTPPVKNVGKPCAGEPHARFDGRGLETEPRPAETAPVPDPPIDDAILFASHHGYPDG